jgi:hypothetical protein
MEGGLASGKADAIDPVSKRAEAIQDAFEGKGGVLFGAEDEGVVMAVKAAEIAAGQEEDGANLPRPVNEGGF